MHTTINIVNTNVCISGIKKYGENTVAVILKELKQLATETMVGKPVTVPQDPFKLTDKEKNVDCCQSNKRKGKLKGQTYANGTK